MCALYCSSKAMASALEMVASAECPFAVVDFEFASAAGARPRLAKALLICSRTVDILCALFFW